MYWTEGACPWELLSGKVKPSQQGKLQLSVYLLLRPNGWIDEWVGGQMGDGGWWWQIGMLIIKDVWEETGTKRGFKAVRKTINGHEMGIKLQTHLVCNLTDSIFILHWAHGDILFPPSGPAKWVSEHKLNSRTGWISANVGTIKVQLWSEKFIRIIYLLIKKNNLWP